MQLHRGNQLYMLRRGDGHAVAKQERQADEWAARLLVPSTELLELVRAGMSQEELAEHFGVPAFGVDVAIGIFARRTA